MKQGLAREWYCQYQQVITPEEGNYCKKAWYEERYDYPPGGLWIYAASDLAITEDAIGRDPDFTEHAIFGLEGLELDYDYNGDIKATADKIYVLDWWYGKTTADVWLEELIKLCEQWKPQVWFGTKGMIKNTVEGFMAREMRRQHCDVILEWLSDSKDKSAKGRPLQAFSNSRRIIFPSGKPWADRAIQNICTFPNARHDDAFDAAANMCRALGEIPDAFIGAPMKEDREPVDRYEVIDIDDYKSWKVA